MKKNRILLSICIPTYERPDCIFRSLSNLSEIFSQLKISDKVEICISDNSNDKKTALIVQKFLTSNLKIAYFAWGKNVGYDKNALQALNLAQGKFLLLSSDEITYSKEAIYRLISYLEYLEENSTIILSLSSGKKFIAPIKNPLQQFISIRGIIKQVGLPLTTCIFSRKTYKKFLSEYMHCIHNFFIGTSFVHFPLFVYAITKRKTYYASVKLEDQNRTNVASKPSIPMPSDIAKLCIYRFYLIYVYCRRIGLITHENFLLFKKNFLFVLPILTLRVRILVHPVLLSTELSKITSYINKINCIPIAEQLFIKFFILNKIIPYHILYEIFCFYKIYLRKDTQFVNFFEYYLKKKKGAPYHFN